MNLRIEVPDKVWGRLATLADKRDVKVAALVGDAVEGLLVLEREGLQPLRIPLAVERDRLYQDTTDLLVSALRRGRMDVVRALLEREAAEVARRTA